MPDNIDYIGRFAPSPTGPLHFGSLIAAVGSYLQARHAEGKWLLRIEDLDKPREAPGASRQIIDTLAAFGFEWDGPITYQSHRLAVYEDALADLIDRQLVYRCHCTRKMILAQGGRGDFGLVYPGNCRHQGIAGEGGALRVITDDHLIEFHDRLRGPYGQCLQSQVGDFVLRRADGLFAYQLAVVVDDAAQHITEVVRGADLLDNTPRQIYLQRLLNVPTPGYLHLPLIVNGQAQKLSKQTGAPAIDNEEPISLLIKALTCLQQSPPPRQDVSRLDDLWRWAIQHWQVNRIPCQHQLMPA